MKDWKSTLVSPQKTIREVIQTIDAGALQIALVVDESRKLLGTVTDGDIRRAILRAVPLDAPVTDIMNSHPATARQGGDASTLLSEMRARQLSRIPLLDVDGAVVGVELLEELVRPAKSDNWVVLMAGGLGVRLRPLTDECPKPMLKVGDKPLLETIVENFVEQGFTRFFVSVNYMAEKIKAHFGNGSSLGADITYLEERNKLGTAGALGLLPEIPEKPVLVMNGDLLTKVSFRQLLDFHHAHRSQATMCVREYDFQVPYGVVKIDHHRITAIDEKPVHRFFVNAGIYVLQPQVLSHIQPGVYSDMPTLFEKVIAEGGESAVFPIREYWMDIGQMSDYDRANGEFSQVFA